MWLLVPEPAYETKLDNHCEPAPPMSTTARPTVAVPLLSNPVSLMLILAVLLPGPIRSSPFTCQFDPPPLMLTLPSAAAATLAPALETTLPPVLMVRVPLYELPISKVPLVVKLQAADDTLRLPTACA